MRSDDAASVGVRTGVTIVASWAWQHLKIAHRSIELSSAVSREQHRSVGRAANRRIRIEATARHATGRWSRPIDASSTATAGRAFTGRGDSVGSRPITARAALAADLQPVARPSREKVRHSIIEIAAWLSQGRHAVADIGDRPVRTANTRIANTAVTIHAVPIGDASVAVEIGAEWIQASPTVASR